MIKNAPRKSKFRNIKTIIDGTEFASKLEAGRYAQLKLMERAGLIGDLETQRSFDLTVNGIVVTRYIADFVYVAAGSLELVVEDAKGLLTPLYRLKKKMMMAEHGIAIREFKASARKSR